MIIRSTWNSRLDYLTSQTSQISAALSEINQTVSSGLEVERPSDAPELVARIASTETAIADQERYADSAGTAQGLLSTADSTLSALASVLADAQSLAVQMSSESYDGESRVASATQAEELLGEALSLVNAQLGDRYLFAGTAYDQPAFADDLSYSGSTEASTIEVGDGVDVVVGFDGESLGLGEILTAMSELQSALEADDTEGVQDSLGALNDALDVLVTAQTTIGAQHSTAIDFEDFSTSMGVELSSHLSSLQDADMVASLMRLSELQTMYETSLAVTASSDLGSLFDRI